VTKGHSQLRALTLGVLMIMGLTLCGGCTPIDSTAVGTFLSDLLRNATAAWLL